MHPNRLMLALVSGVIMLHLSGCERSADDALADAKARIAKDDNAGADIELKNLLQRHPDSAEARYLLGLQAQKRGDIAAGLIELQRARDLKYPDNIVAPAIAKSLLAQGKFRMLIDEFGKTDLFDVVATAELQGLVAQAMHFEGDTLGAIDLIDKAAAAAPASEPVLLAKASFEAQAGRAEQAVAVLDRLIAQKPDSHLAWTMKGNVLGVLPGQRGAALDAFRKALDIKPTAVETLQQARDALDTIIAREGFAAPAPVGPDTVARLQERVLQRLVELGQDSLDRGQALEEIANLAERRGDKVSAEEARRRAAGLRREREVAPEEPRAQVDDRLDALLGEVLRGGTPGEQAQAAEVTQSAARRAASADDDDPGPIKLAGLGLGGRAAGERQTTRPLPTLPRLKSALKAANAAASAAAPEPAVVEPEAPKLDTFRAKMQDIWKTPGSLAAAAAKAQAALSRTASPWPAP